MDDARFRGSGGGNLPRVRVESVIAAAAVAVGIAACSCPTASADPTSESPPFPIGQMGVPVHARAADGATADITVDSATWLPPGCTTHFAVPTPDSACNVVELTITATSHRFFLFDQSYIFAGYGGGNQPWTHPDDAPQPATLAVDYRRLDKMPPLQSRPARRANRARLRRLRYADRRRPLHHDQRSGATRSLHRSRLDRPHLTRPPRPTSLARQPGL